MPDFSPESNSENTLNGIEVKKWHIKQVRDAIENGKIVDVLKALKHAWVTRVDVTSAELKEDEEYNEDLFDSLATFFLSKIENGELSPKNRIEIYKMMRDYDVPLAEVFITRLGEYGADEYLARSREEILNPTELYKTQCDHYVWLVERGYPMSVLRNVLDQDGHLDNTSPYYLGDTVKEIIVGYAENYLNGGADEDEDESQEEAAHEILQALDKDRPDRG